MVDLNHSIEAGIALMDEISLNAGQLPWLAARDAALYDSVFAKVDHAVNLLYKARSSLFAIDTGDSSNAAQARVSLEVAVAVRASDDARAAMDAARSLVMSRGDVSAASGIVEAFKDTAIESAQTAARVAVDVGHGAEQVGHGVQSTLPLLQYWPYILGAGALLYGLLLIQPILPRRPS